MSTVSIILPTLNGVPCIHRAVESVIAQSYTDWELIVVDDGSTEDIARALPQDARIRYLKNDTNQGIQRSLNRGLAEARGKYIARIDDDDVWSDAAKLSTQVAFLESHPDHILVGTGVVIADESGLELQRYHLPLSDAAIRSKMLRKNCFVHSSVVFRNTGIRYSQEKNAYHAEDYELWLRLGREGKLANLPMYAVTYTAREGSLTSRNRRIQAWRILKLAWQYRSLYPHAVFGIVIAMVRYLFFVSQAIIPFPSSIRYLIQKKQKSM